MFEDDSRESKQNIIILYRRMASIQRSGSLLVLCRHPWTVWNDRIRGHDWLWFVRGDMGARLLARALSQSINTEVQRIHQWLYPLVEARYSLVQSSESSPTSQFCAAIQIGLVSVSNWCLFSLVGNCLTNQSLAGDIILRCRMENSISMQKWWQTWTRLTDIYKLL